MVSRSDRILRSGVAHHQSGNLRAAEAEYRSVLAEEPNNADALHLLGVLAAQAGHLTQGTQLLRAATALRPGFVDALCNLGRLLFDQGEIEESIASYKQVTSIQPANATAWYALGVAYRRAGNAKQARGAFETVLVLAPNHAEALNELGKICRGDNDPDRARALVERALSLQPNLADAHHTLGNCDLDANRVDQAVGSFNRAVQLAPQTADYHASLGESFLRQEKFSEAAAELSVALALKPAFPRVLDGMGVALGELGRYDEAIKAHCDALEVEPTNLTWLQHYGDTLVLADQFKLAEDVFRRLIGLDASRPSAWVGLGHAVRSFGRFDEARECFRHALKLNPGETIAYKALSAITSETDAREVERLSELLADPKLLDRDRIAANFSLGKLLDDADQYDEAFARFEEGNLLCRQALATENLAFNRAAFVSSVSKKIERWSPEAIEALAGAGQQTEQPVFIVGMPRSGTTLIEQICATHPQVYGCGELSQIWDKGEALEAQGSPVSWDRKHILQCAHAYRESVNKVGAGASRTTDKLPANILHVGLIWAMFPRARVIFCQRDPRDNCLSCYFQLFKRNSLGFSYDLVDCATQFLQQERLRAHWQAVLPLRMMTIQYEELVADLEGQSRRLIDFLGLPWDSRCLDFHKTERTVATASVWQVRQPLYSSSVGRWKHYEKHLGPLIEALGMRGA